MMKPVWKHELKALFGKRMVKTAVSVFITAWICSMLQWPVIFAVIAAIVTIEPTVNSSVRRGIVRLPAAAMGAAFAMMFDSLLGQVPLAYALSAFFTIYCCHRLHWDHAIIVATLTAVNMITLTEDDFLTNFFIRIGTTSVGIIVSTLVNFFVFPPNFTKDIHSMYERLVNDICDLLQSTLQYQIYNEGNEATLSHKHTLTLKQLERTSQLIKYQQDEYRYHRFQMQSAKSLSRLSKKLHHLQYITFHIGSMLSMSHEDPFHPEDQQLLWQAGTTIVSEFESFSGNSLLDDQQCNIQQAVTSLISWLQNPQSNDNEMMSLSKGSIIAYELLAIHKIMCKPTFHQKVVDSSCPISGHI